MLGPSAIAVAVPLPFDDEVGHGGLAGLAVPAAQPQPQPPRPHGAWRAAAPLPMWAVPAPALFAGAGLYAPAPPQMFASHCYGGMPCPPGFASAVASASASAAAPAPALEAETLRDEPRLQEYLVQMGPVHAPPARPPALPGASQFSGDTAANRACRATR